MYQPHAPLEPGPQNDALDAQQFRKFVAMFATGIAVVTCEDSMGAVHGATINSFTSISLEPATVLVSLRPGRMHRLISGSGRFGISVLNESQQDHSSHFSGHPLETLDLEFAVRSQVPTLRECLAWFECSTMERVQVHDHTLFIARVSSCGGGNGSPLIFFGSRYHKPAFAP
jgi:flavin reductase (DIM6/NTAB) family NADH-FMN oxidoreductase RutF